jgi:S-adenosylmethionine:tRNA ribosyltransferase-isomerase
MKVDGFDFELPRNLIARRPADPRDSAKLLVVGDEDFKDRSVHDLPDLLRPGDLLVCNDTRVFAARLCGTRAADRGTASIEIMLNRQSSIPHTWAAFARPAKRLVVGDRIQFSGDLAATVTAKGDGGEVTVKFSHKGGDLLEAMEAVGEIPLPPYIGRPADDADSTDYQTMFADRTGAVAAPTAGLHFTPDLAERLEAAGIGIARVTLHVGAGTFQPVKVDDTDNHVMHPEWGEISDDTAAQVNAARTAGGRIVTVGTTALRVLETAADGQGQLRAFSGDTDLFITPGYAFRGADLLITNFHLPRSTLFMLVCAIAGTQRMKEAYAHAKSMGYQFYSYGDACLLTMP